MSREAWGVIIAHELLHLVITKENLNELGSQYDHMFIFTSFVEPVRDLLVEAFGITESDALKLSLSGINDLWAYGDFEQLCTTRYGVSFTAMNNTLDSYTKGTGGTKCN